MQIPINAVLQNEQWIKIPNLGVENPAKYACIKHYAGKQGPVKHYAPIHFLQLTGFDEIGTPRYTDLKTFTGKNIHKIGEYFDHNKSFEVNRRLVETEINQTMRDKMQGGEI